MAATPISATVVHWNQPERCLDTMRTLVDQGHPLDVRVVDNGSRPEARSALVAGLDELAARPDVRSLELVDLEGNQGFGPAANAGLGPWLRTGVGEWALVAPHDVLVAPGTLSAILSAVSERPRVGLVSADVGDGASPVVDRYLGGISEEAAVTEGYEPADHPHGTFLLVRRACVADVGLFDERYFAYCEEADLALRARASGWEVGLVRGALVGNPHMTTASAAVDYLQVRNTLLLLRDHFRRYAATVRTVIAVLDLLDGLLRPARRPPFFSVEARLLAISDFLRSRWGAPPRRLQHAEADPSREPLSQGPARSPRSAAATTGRTLSR